MTDVMEILAAAKRDVRHEPIPTVDDVWSKLDNGVEEKGRASRSLAGLPRRPLTRWATLGAAALAAAVAMLVVGTTGGGPASAFAGWTPDPTPPTTAQVQAASSSCQQTPDQFNVSVPLASTLAAPPTVADTRGPFSLLVYTDSTGDAAMCIAGLGFANGAESAVFGGPPGSEPATATPIAADAISLYYGLAVFRSASGVFSFVIGRVGADVTGVTVALANDSPVEATTSNGWFAAWWPGVSATQSATITTTSGTTTTTQPLLPNVGRNFSGATPPSTN